MKYALIDMGSNSIRLTVYDISQTGFRILFKEKIMAGLAGYVENGRITEEGIDCACHSLKEFQETLQLLRIEELAVFATASLRNISNTSQAVEQIRQRTGILVEVISGEMEAECGFYGASQDIKITEGLFVDIGGASTELTLFSNGRIQSAGSVPVGSLKLYRDWVKKILPGRESRRQIEDAICKAFDSQALAGISARDHLVCVGGTARAVLRLCRKRFDIPEDCCSFTVKQLNELAEDLCKGDKKAADLILRHAPERIHTLIPGVMILRCVVDRYEGKELTVSQYGVREGYLQKRIRARLFDVENT